MSSGFKSDCIKYYRKYVMDYMTRGAKHYFPTGEFFLKFAHVVEKAVWKNLKNSEKSWKIPKNGESYAILLF